MRAILIGIVGACTAVATSWAQPAGPPDATPPAPAPAPDGAPTAPAAPGAPGAIDPAWDAYDDAFQRAATGDRSGARTRLDGLAERWPLHPAAARASSLVRRLAPRPLDPDAPSRVARGELVFWSTVGGAFVAGNVCVIADCSSDRETAAVYTISVGGSLALALLASSRGVAPAEAQLYNSAQTWGSWNGLGFNDDLANDSEQAGIALGAQGLGLLAGIGLWKVWHPSQGDVALTNTFLLWSSVLSVWGHLAADADPTLRRVVITGDIGLVLGALTSRYVKMSRGRTLLLDIGGALGVLGGGLVAVGLDNDEGVGTALLVGTAAGLGIAVAATKDWDAPPVTIAPARITSPTGAATWGVSAAFGF